MSINQKKKKKIQKTTYQVASHQFLENYRTGSDGSFFHIYEGQEGDWEKPTDLPRLNCVEPISLPSKMKWLLQLMEESSGYSRTLTFARRLT